MPEGKPAGERCIQLDDLNRCQIFGLPERPRVCLQFSATADVCGKADEEAFALLRWLEEDTLPQGS